MRTFFTIALVASALLLPWWTTAIVLVCACFLCDRYFEAIAIGVLADALYGSAIGWHGFSYMGTAFALAALVFAGLVRDRLAW